MAKAYLCEWWLVEPLSDGSSGVEVALAITLMIRYNEHEHGTILLEHLLNFVKISYTRQLVDLPSWGV